MQLELGFIDIDQRRFNNNIIERAIFDKWVWEKVDYTEFPLLLILSLIINWFPLSRLIVSVSLDNIRVFIIGRVHTMAKRIILDLNYFQITSKAIIRNLIQFYDSLLIIWFQEIWFCRRLL